MFLVLKAYLNTFSVIFALNVRSFFSLKFDCKNRKLQGDVIIGIEVYIIKHKELCYHEKMYEILK